MVGRSSKRKNYFNRELFILKLCGISTKEQESVAYNIYAFIARYVLTLSYPFVASHDLNKHGFDVFSQTFAIFLSTSLACISSVTVYIYRLKLGRLLNRLQEEPFLPNSKRGGDKEEALISKWMLSLKIQGLLLYVPPYACITFGVIFSIIKRIKCSSSQDWIYTFPYGPLTILDVTRSPNYEISWIYQNFALIFAANILNTTIILLSGILAYICVQFQMLQNNLRTLTKSSFRAKSDTSEIPGLYLKDALKKAVCYHLNILEVISEVNDIFSLFMLALYLILLSVLCFIMYTASVVLLNDPGILLLFCEADVAYCLVFIVCYWGEQMAYESEQVGIAAYEADFVGTDLRFQKDLMMIMRRSQKTTRIKAGKFVDTSMATFAWIARSSFSFFMIVKKLNE